MTGDWPPPRAAGPVEVAAMTGPLPEHDGVRWETDDHILRANRYDRSGWWPEVRPRAVAVAGTVAGVQAVLRYAHDTGTPVVPRGAGTGLAGAATAIEGGIVLDLSTMDSILELRPDDELAVVEPGVRPAELDRAAGRHGLRYAPDPASVEISTIGGNIATNAGGLRCAKYGVTRDAVLGLSVVLADGRLIHTGRRAVKGVTGYDLTGLFVGSEGTLGIIVGATLRLRPVPPGSATLSVFFPDADTAIRAFAGVRATGVVPALAEFVDGPTLAQIDAHLGSRLRSRGNALVLIQVDGLAAEREAEVLSQVLGPTATELVVTTDPTEAAGLLAVRRAALPALEQTGRVLIEDISVPRSQLATAVAEVARIGAATGTSIYTFAHLADGNLHPIVVLAPGQQPTDPAVVAAADQLFALALRLGGTVSGEHGVGLLKLRWMMLELGEDVVAIQHQLKAVLDPRGVLNPGRAI